MPMYPDLQDPAELSTLSEAGAVADGVPGKGAPVIGVDTEWTVSRPHRPSSERVDVLQLSSASRSLVLHLSRMSTTPSILKELMNDPSVLKVGKSIGIDKYKLEQAGILCRTTLDVAVYAKRTHLVSRSSLSLQALSEKLLRRTIKKNDYVRLSDWRAPLEADQVQYAAVDAFASLRVYMAVMEATARFVDRWSLAGGMEVYLMDDGGNMRVAKCVVCDGQPASYNTYKLAEKDRALVRIVTVLVPGFLVPYSRRRPLPTLQQVTDDAGTSEALIVLDMRQLRDASHPSEADAASNNEEEAVSFPPVGPSDGVVDPRLEATVHTEQLARARGGTSKECVDDGDGEEDRDTGDAGQGAGVRGGGASDHAGCAASAFGDHADGTPCAESMGADDLVSLSGGSTDLEEDDDPNGCELLGVGAVDEEAEERDGNDIVKSTLKMAAAGTLSGVNADVWHVMDRIMRRVHKNHGAARLFSRCLSHAIMLYNKKDAEAARAVAVELFPELTWGGVIIRRAAWVNKRVRRVVPAPDVLVTRLRALSDEFAPIRDAKTDEPLFNAAKKKAADLVLLVAQEGWLSDPPNVNVYIMLWRDNKGLPVWLCSRGSNANEGGVHQKLVKNFMVSKGASPELIHLGLYEFAHRHNTRSAHRIRRGFNNVGLYDLWLVDSICVEEKDLHERRLSYPNWQSASDFSVDAPPACGVVPMPLSRVEESCIPVGDDCQALQPLLRLYLEQVRWLAQAMGTGVPVLPVHTWSEIKMFRSVREDLYAMRGDEVPTELELTVEFNKRVTAAWAAAVRVLCTGTRRRGARPPDVFFKTPEKIRSYMEFYKRSENIVRTVRLYDPATTRQAISAKEAQYVSFGEDAESILPLFGAASASAPAASASQTEPLPSSSGPATSTPNVSLTAGRHGSTASGRGAETQSASSAPPRIATAVSSSAAVPASCISGRAAERGGLGGAAPAVSPAAQKDVGGTGGVPGTAMVRTGSDGVMAQGARATVEPAAVLPALLPSQRVSFPQCSGWLLGGAASSATGPVGSRGLEHSTSLLAPVPLLPLSTAVTPRLDMMPPPPSSGALLPLCAPHPRLLPTTASGPQAFYVPGAAAVPPAASLQQQYVPVSRGAKGRRCARCTASDCPGRWMGNPCTNSPVAMKRSSAPARSAPAGPSACEKAASTNAGNSAAHSRTSPQLPPSKRARQ